MWDRLPWLFGTAANRPAASAMPYSGWFATDTLVASVSDGTTWHTLSAGSGSGGGGGGPSGPWIQDNVAASQSAVALTLLDSVRDTIRAPSAGSLTAVVIGSNAARTAGTLTVEVTKNGVGTGITATLDATNTTWHAGTGSVTVAAGDEIGVDITTDASWAPTTADITVAVQLGTSPAETAKATRQSTTQSIPNSALTAISFDTEVWDTDGIVTLGTSATRLTIQTAGKYDIIASCRFAANTTGDRVLQIRKNGSPVADIGTRAMAGATVPTSLALTFPDQPSASDYYEAFVFQTSGAGLNLEADARNYLSVGRRS